MNIKSPMRAHRGFFYGVSPDEYREMQMANQVHKAIVAVSHNCFSPYF